MGFDSMIVAGGLIGFVEAEEVRYGSVKRK